MIDKSTVPAAGDAEVVFVYSCFRAASTWFWSRLRTQQKFYCYYEVFNERLEHLVPADVPNLRPDTWRSHHPHVEPYLLEYVPLLGDTPGVSGFPVENPPGSRFMGRGGVEGPLDEDVRDYIARLIEHARAGGRVPVITDPRLLARAAGMRAAFGGRHVVLIRNLFEQWVSVGGQWRAGNDYFIRMVFDQLRCGRKDHFFSFLMTRFPSRDRTRFEDWASDANLDTVFGCYVASRIYLLLHARRHCDLEVDITNLGNSAYRMATEASLARCLGASIGLADFERHVDYPKQLVQSPDDCRKAMEALVERALSDAGADAGERAFANGLLEDVWRAHREFMVQTTGARGLVESAEAHAHDLQQAVVAGEAEHAREAKSLQAALSESQGYASSLETRLASMEHEHAGHVASLQAALSKSQGHATALDTRLSGMEREHAEHAASLQAALSESQGYAASLETRLAGMEHEYAGHVASLQAALSESQGYAASLETRLASMEHEHAGHVASLQAALSGAQSHATSLAARLESTEQQRRACEADWRGELARLQQHAARLEQVIAVRDHEFTEQDAVLRGVQREHAEYTASMQAALSESQAYATSLAARIAREQAGWSAERAAILAESQARMARMERRFRWFKWFWPKDTTQGSDAS